MGKVITLLLSLFCLAATWSVDQGPVIQWAAEEQAKWATEEIDSPDPGWYRSPFDFRVPDTWPDWARDSFLSLSRGLSEERRNHANLWSVPQLQVSTLWIDAMADKTVGSIEATIPDYSFFTFVLTDPPDGIIDQTFQGKAKIYGLKDDVRYRIMAWDARDLLGMSVTGISDKYIHVLPDTLDTFSSVRVPVMGQKVVEDPAKDLWASVYQPRSVGGSYQFVDIYSLTMEGDIRSKFNVPVTTTSVRPWLTDLILESNGDVTFSACEDPMGLSAYFGPSYVARLEKNGSTVWTTPTNEISSAICIAPIGDGGYVYGGATFTTDPLELDKQFGRIVRLDATGGHTNWPVSGTTYLQKSYSIRDIKRSSELYAYVGISGTTVEITETMGGSCSSTDGTCANVFDEDYGTYISKSGDGDWLEMSVTWDFGAIQPSTGVSIYVKGADNDPVDHNYFLSLQGSDNGIDWDTLHVFGLLESDGVGGWANRALSESHSYRYFKATIYTFGYLGITWTLYIAELDILGFSDPSASGTANYHYAAGRYNLGSAGRLFSAIQTDGCPSSAVGYETTDANACQAMDADFDGISWAGEGNCGVALVGVGWDDGSQTAVNSKVWYSTTRASTITLQYDNAGWQNISSVAATADGNIHLWEVSFAAITASNWRVTFTTDGGAPCAPYLQEWQLYPPTTTTGGGIVSKQVLSGVTGGTELWGTKYTHPESEAGIFNAVAISPRDESRIYAFGSSEHSVVNLSLNKGIGLCVNQSGTSIWYKDFPQVSEFYDAAPTEDGGFLLAGTLYSGTSVQTRSAVIMKIDKDGNVDGKFPQTFKDPSQLGNDGRGVIETRDYGALMIGGSSDTGSRSQPYFIKLDRFQRPCSSGAPCE